MKKLSLYSLLLFWPSLDSCATTTFDGDKEPRYWVCLRVVYYDGRGKSRESGMCYDPVILDATEPIFFTSDMAYVDYEGMEYKIMQMFPYSTWASGGTQGLYFIHQKRHKKNILELYNARSLLNVDCESDFGEEENQGKIGQEGHGGIFSTYTASEIKAMARGLQELHYVYFKEGDTEAGKENQYRINKEKFNIDNIKERIRTLSTDEGYQEAKKIANEAISNALLTSSDSDEDSDSDEEVRPKVEESTDSTDKQSILSREPVVPGKDFSFDSDVDRKRAEGPPMPRGSLFPITGSIKIDIGLSVLVVAILGIGFKLLLFRDEEQTVPLHEEEEDDDDDDEL